MTQEGFLFPGVTVPALLLLGAAALVIRGNLKQAVTRRSAAVFYSAAAVVFWWLCFGPADSHSIGDVLSQTVLAAHLGARIQRAAGPGPLRDDGHALCGSRCRTRGGATRATSSLEPSRPGDPGSGKSRGRQLDTPDAARGPAAAGRSP